MDTIRLIGIGRQYAKPAGEFSPGDVMLFNYGYPSEVLSVEPVKKSVRLRIRDVRSGKEYTLQKRATTMTAYSKRKGE